MTYQDQARCVPRTHVRRTEEETYTPEPFIPNAGEADKVDTSKYGFLWDMTADEILKLVHEFKRSVNSNVVVWLATPLWKRMIDNERAKIMLQAEIDYASKHWEEGYYKLGDIFCYFAHDPRIRLDRNVDPIFIRSTKHLQPDELIAPMVRMERERKEAERLMELPLFGIDEEEMDIIRSICHNKKEIDRMEAYTKHLQEAVSCKISDGGFSLANRKPITEMVFNETNYPIIKKIT